MGRKGARLGLALGGGAARGIAHVGVLKVLAQEGIPVSALAGVSVGSIVAAGWAAGLPVERLEEIARSVRWRDVGRWSFSLNGVNSNKRMEQFLAEHLPVRTFEELRIPLRVVATDLITGRPVCLEKGDLFTAIRASCAIPGLYVPVPWGEFLLADGYLSCNLPVRQVREMGVEVVLASAIGMDVSGPVQLSNIYQILIRAFSIMSAAVQRYNVRDADVVVQPRVEQFSWTDLGSAEQLIRAGEEAMRRRLPALQKRLHPSLWERLRRRLAPASRSFARDLSVAPPQGSST